MSSVRTARVSRRTSDAAAHAHARLYGDALRVADSAAAGQVVDDALAAGLSASAVQSLVIAPALVRIGELWAANAVTVADEHLATAISQGVMVRLFDRLNVARACSRERVLLAAVEGQHHTVGLRMVADVLEGAGFDVLYLGADVPVDALRQFAAKHQPVVTGLAFGVSVGVGVLADSIHAVCEACPATRIMLGGQAVPPGLVEAGYPVVDTSMEAVLTVERLLRESSRPVPKVVGLLRPTHRPSADGRDTDFVSDDVAERLAAVSEEASEQAREYVRSARALRDLALRDPVTDLGNRRAFDDRLFEQSQRQAEGEAGSLLMIDVDEFKVINDTHGHAEGDRLLRSIGSAITGTLRSHDFAARVGGDEFAVLLAKAGADVAPAIAGRIREAVSASTHLPVTVSIGVAPLTADFRCAVLSADAALYEAKRAGRDRVVARSAPEPAATSAEAGS
jgi:diguanylate cyclase (GGDEF)-like protein